MLIEFATGSLPWRRIKDKDQVGEMKIRCNTSELVSDLPPEFLKFWQHLQTLRYEDEPDYGMLSDLFTQCLVTAGGTVESSPFDWEFSGATAGSRERTLPSLRSLCLHALVRNMEEDLGRSVASMLNQNGALQEEVLALVLRRSPMSNPSVVLRLVGPSTTKVDATVLPGGLKTLGRALESCGDCLQTLRLGDMQDVLALTLVRSGRLASVTSLSSPPHLLRSAMNLVAGGAM